jgi:hypothetical protein
MNLIYAVMNSDWSYFEDDDDPDSPFFADTEPHGTSIGYI